MWRLNGKESDSGEDVVDLNSLKRKVNWTNLWLLGKKKRRIWEGRDYSCIVMRMAKVEREEKYAERIGMQWGSVGHRYNSNTGACVSRFGGKLLFNSAAFVIVGIILIFLYILWKLLFSSTIKKKVMFFS